MKLSLIKKILFTIFIFIFFLKLVDLILIKFVGLGNPLIYQHSKIFGYDIKPNQKIKRRGKTITINDAGMRNLKNWKEKYEKKILFIGDSVTFGGSLLNDEDTFVIKICEKFKKIKTICGNYAVNGYGIEAIYNKIQFKNINDEDLLVLIFIGNNFERGLIHLGIQPYFSKKIMNFFPALTEITLMVIDKFRNQIRFKYSNLSENKKTYLNYQLKQIENLKKTIINNKREYLIFYSPEYSELNNNKNYEYIKIILSNEFENFIDLTDDLKKYKNEIYFDNVHLNKFGHKIYSDLIYKKILKYFDF
tara:strand:- start:163 stop:1077 length:915 start_codon:yes stop_codon:yes gene_type:complete